MKPLKAVRLEPWMQYAGEGGKPSGPCIPNIDESNVSIVIPTFCRPERVAFALESALATGAGEIIVSDDSDNDETAGILRKFRDPRIRIIRNRERLGLWKNHLSALGSANRPWIKFLQDDDILSPDALRVMLSHATRRTAVISALPLFENWPERTRWTPFVLRSAIRWERATYLPRMVVVGNSELGNPSCSLFRSDVLERTEAAWADDMSCDLVANVIAAGRGEAVIVPPGPVIVSLHGGQDTNRQGSALAERRAVNAVKYMKTYPDPHVRKFACAYEKTERLTRLFLGVLSMTHRKNGSLRDIFNSYRCSSGTPFPLDAIAVVNSLKRIAWNVRCWNMRKVVY